MLKTGFALLLFCLGNLSQAATLVYNVQGYTMDQGRRVSFVALEYEDGVVTRLHHKAETVAGSAATRRIDGAGATLLPGLIDAHGHIFNHGKLLSNVNLVGSPSEEDSVQRVADFINGAGDTPWIIGRGWNQVLWPVKNFPRRTSLDRISAGKAIALKRVDGHALWSTVRHCAGLA